MNPNKMQFTAYGTGQALQQLADLTTPLDTTTDALPNHTSEIVTMCLDTTEIVNVHSSAGTGTYAWDNASTYPAGATVVKSIADWSGNTRQITFLFYQVNDTGTASPPVNPNPPHQAAWAWYAFETTGGAQPASSNILGGTGIIQGEETESLGFLPWVCFMNRGVTGDFYWGDLVYFNSDGTLASEGMSRNDGTQAKPEIVLPDIKSGWNNSAVPASVLTRVGLNFGTAGLLGYGKTDGLTGNAAPSNVN